MKALKTAAGLVSATAISLFAVAPAMALEEQVPVPPENSAVNQYTEAFPTAGGDREAHNHQGRNVSPGKVIGAKNAKKLDQRGAAGRATAKFAADTAPHPTPGQGTAVVVITKDNQGPGQSTNSGGNSGGGGGQPTDQSGNNTSEQGAGSARVVTTPAAHAEGSSGLSEVLSSATGGSGDGMGLFLPLLIIAAIAWAIAYTVRQRRPVS